MENLELKLQESKVTENKQNYEQIPNEYLELSFEEAMEKLEFLVKSLEKSNITLEEAVKLYEEGNFLALHCQNKLKEAELSLKKYMPEEDIEVEL